MAAISAVAAAEPSLHGLLLDALLGAATAPQDSAVNPSGNTTSGATASTATGSATASTAPPALALPDATISTTLSELAAARPAAQAWQASASPAAALVGSTAAVVAAEAAAAPPTSSAGPPTTLPGSAVPLTPLPLTPLFTLASDPPRQPRLARDSAAPPRRRRPHPAAHDRDGAAHDDERWADAVDDTPSETPLPDAPATHTAGDEPDYTAWTQRLRDAGQTEALRELDQRRRVLVVCPAAAAGRASAWLLSAQPRGTALRFAARWSAGATTDANPIAWLAWRLHRCAESADQDGGGDLTRSLRTRPTATGEPGCRIGLDAPSCGVRDPAGCQLDPTEPQRFARALGTQWSLLVLRAPGSA